MRFLLSVATVAMLALILFACGGSERGGEAQPPAAAPPAEVAAEASPEATPEVAAAPRSEVPIRFDIFPRRTQFVLGEPVEIFVQHTNLWDEPVGVRCNYFLDMGFEIWITDSAGQSMRFIDQIHSGIPVPNYARIPGGESRGFYELLVHSEVDDRGPIFTAPGIYRIDAQVQAQIEALGNEVLLLRAPPITIEIVEPFTAADRAVHGTFLHPEVTLAVQRMTAPPELEESLQSVIDVAPESVFAEHAHWLLGMICMEREDWLLANEHFYEVYGEPDGFYPKDMVLINIIQCFDRAVEPERAVATCRVLVDLFPTIGTRGIPLIDSYIELMGEVETE